MTRRFDDSIPFDSSRSGLPCRFQRCPRVFAVMRQDDPEALREAARERNTHEAQAHAYEHPKTEPALADGPNISPTIRSKGRRGRAKVRS